MTNQKYLIFTLDEFNDIVSEAIANIYYQKNKDDTITIPYDVVRVAIESAAIAGQKMKDRLESG